MAEGENSGARPEGASARRWRVYACANWRRELAAIVSRGNGEVTAEQLAIACEQRSTALRLALADGRDAGAVVLACEPCGDGVSRECPRACIHHVSQCSELAAPKALLDDLRQAKACVLVPEQLAAWAERIRLGEVEAARAFFGGHSRLVALDTGVHGDLEPKLKAVSEIAGLPAERIPIGLDLLEQRISRTMAEAGHHAEAAALGEPEFPDASWAIDLMAAMSEMRSEREALAGMLEVFAAVLDPRQVLFLPVEAGKPREPMRWPAGPASEEERALLMRAWTDPASLGLVDGFVGTVESHTEVVGLLLLDGLGFPTWRRQSTQLIEGIARVCGLAIGNARAFQTIGRQESRARLLNDAGRALVGALAPGPALMQVARLAAGDLAEMMTIDLVEPEDRLRRVAVACIDPEAETRLHSHESGPPGLLAVQRRALLKLEPQAGTAPEDLSWLLAPGAVKIRRPMLTIPLVSGERALGVMVLVGAAGAEEFTSDERSLAEELARRCTVAVENARLYQQARSALASRDQLIAGVSHDLRNPMAAAIARIDRLAMNTKSRGWPAAILDECAALRARFWKVVEQLEELVELAPLSAGAPLELAREPMDLVKLVRELAEEQEESVRQRLRVEADSPSIIGEWDAGLLERLLANLVHNAVKYSPEGGEIQVRVRIEDRRALLSVQDHGVGIPAADLPNIFEGLFRAKNALRFPGTGLGLAKVRRIAEAHGGTVHADSAEGNGTTITVTLPFA